MSRIAHCSCGALRVEVSGEPALVAACHCIACQRRTGSPFGVTTYSSKTRCAPRGRTRPTAAAAMRSEKSNSIFAPTAALQCSGTRSLIQASSASPLARSLIRRC